jgi:hypothetical protein
MKGEMMYLQRWQIDRLGAVQNTSVFCGQPQHKWLRGQFCQELHRGHFYFQEHDGCQKVRGQVPMERGT